VSGPGYAMFGADEERNLLDALRTGTLTRYRFGMPGAESYVYRFERAAREHFGSPHCLALNSGTSALLTALVANGIGPGDEVIVPGYMFIASIAAVLYAGAVPVLAEIDESLTLDPADFERKITSRTRAVMPVHMLGGAADMPMLTALAQEHSILVIEDVAQACGGSCNGVPLGTWGAAGAFSLNYFKVITAGEGGFCLLADDAAYERGYSFHDHGFKPLRDGAVDADAVFGLNLRMPDLSGALALAQLARLPEILERTQAVRTRLAAAIGEHEAMTPRTSVDPSGDCATTLCYTFHESAMAERMAKSLGTMPLVRSGKHYYGNMPQLQHMGSATLGSAHQGDPMPSYGVGDLPRTDDILARTLALSTGASDWYAGTGFGVGVNSTDHDIELCAQTFREVLASNS